MFCVSIICNPTPKSFLVFTFTPPRNLNNSSIEFIGKFLISFELIIVIDLPDSLLRVGILVADTVIGSSS